MGKIFEKIYGEVKKIPLGETKSYGDIARAVGCNPRIVGYALHKNHDPDNTPCHRVVFSDGRLAPGYIFGGPERQKEKLQKEGVAFDDKNRVIGS